MTGQDRRGLPGTGTAGAPLHTQAQQVQAALDAAGIGSRVRQLPTSTRTAAQAAASLQVPVSAIAKSLIFMADDEPVLVLTSGAHQVDCSHLAAQCGARTVQRATAQQVRTATGQAIGGVAPVGHPRRLRTFLDLQLAAEPVVWAAAGTPNSVFATTYDQLRQLCSAQPVSVTAGIGTSATAVQPDDGPGLTTSAVSTTVPAAASLEASRPAVGSDAPAPAIAPAPGGGCAI